MKKIQYLIIALLALGLASCVVQRETAPPRAAAVHEPAVDFQVFYNELSPYGQWVDYPNYGYVWMPDAGADFTPYATAGRWVLTDDGWTWVSDYAWGWAPFHYGRWDYDPIYGWFWVPGREWGPAWVAWRRAPGYYGWAPLRPGVTVELALNGGYRERDDRWIFVRDVYIVDPEIRYHYLDRHTSLTIINNSTVIINSHHDNRRNAVYIAGPERGDVEHVTRTRLNPVVIREDTRPGHRLQGNELDIYRPQVEDRSRTGQAPVPPRVRQLNDVRPGDTRTAPGGVRQREPAAPAAPAVQPPPVQTAPPPVQTAPPPVQTAPPPVQTAPPTRQREVTPPAGGTQQPPPPANTAPDHTRRHPGQRETAPDQRSRRGQQPPPPGVNQRPAPAQKPQQNVRPQKRVRTAPPEERTRRQEEKKKREE